MSDKRAPAESSESKLRSGRKSQKQFQDIPGFFFETVRKAKLRIAERYQGAQCGGALQTTTRRRTGETILRTE